MSSFNWEHLVDAVVDGRFRLRTLTYAGKGQAEFTAICAGPEGALANVTLLALEPDEIDQVEAEMAAAAGLQHAHLLRILGTGRYRSGSIELLYMASEAPDETLADKLASGPLAEAAAERVLSHVVAGLEYLHGRGLIYRNLSPQTVVRAGSAWKLADYGGMAPEGEPADLSSYLNGSAYTPPEAYDGRLSAAWDMWSFGTLMTELLTGSTSPFLLPVRFEEIRRRCTEKDPAARASSAEVAGMLPRPVVKTQPPPPVPQPVAAAPAPTSKPEPEIIPAPPPDRTAGETRIPASPAGDRAPVSRAERVNKADAPAGVSPRATVVRTQPPAASALLRAVSGIRLNYRNVLWIPALVVLAIFFFWERRHKEPAAAQPKAAANAAQSAPALAAQGVPERPSPMPRPGDERRRQAAITAAERARAAEAARQAAAAQRQAAAEAPKEVTHAGGKAITGRADFAGDDMNGRRTASGERFNNNALTAAARAYPLGTHLRVTNLRNHRSTVVKVNDRGSFRHGYVIRLTKRAARELDFAHTGSAQVKLEVVSGG